MSAGESDDAAPDGEAERDGNVSELDGAPGEADDVPAVAGEADEDDVDGDGVDGDSDDEDGDDGDGVAPWRRSRLDVGAGVVLVLYALWVAAQLGALAVDEGAFDALARLHAGVLGRVCISLVVLAALWHTTQGALTLLGGPWPVVRRREGPVRQVCAFVTLALGIPAVTVVLWPVMAGIPT